MQKPDFTFLTNPVNRLSRWWLLLGVTSLAIAGLFSIVLVVARTPSLSSIPFFVNLFHAAIVVHVDMSMLAWFLCIACLMWSMVSAHKPSPLPMLEESALVSMAAGLLFLALSPLDTKAEALMSNYIPVIHSPVFFFGLTLIGSSVALMIARTLFVMPAKAGIQLALYSSALIALIALIAFGVSFNSIPSVIDGQQYYEFLFWGGGHVLQYLHVQILLVAWIFLAFSLKGEIKILSALFVITPLAALLTPLGYMHEVFSSEHRLFFTHMMIGIGGIAPAILALMIIPRIWRARGQRNALWSSLVASLTLFIVGGVMGMMIEGQDVVIPAHYHGSIIGITLAFMGVAYALLPAFGYRKVTAWKLAYWQPIVYCVGQLMHIFGLAWSGGYGVLRKTPGALEGGFSAAKAAMGLMGMGGLLAAIGGLMFVIVVIRSVFYKD